MSSDRHEILIVLRFQNSFEFPWISIKVSGEKLEEAESRLKTEGETAERGKISAHRDSPLQLAAPPTPLSLTRLSGLSGGSHL